MRIRSDDGEHAVILSGGGAHGAYELGVMQALFSGRWQGGQAGAVEPSIFTGTSVGSFNASFIVAESGSGSEPGCLEAVRRLRQLWLERIAAPGQSENGVFRLRGNPRTYLGDLASNPVKALIKLSEDAGHVVRQSLRRGPNFVLSDAPVSQRLFEQIDLSSFLSTKPFDRLIRDVVVPEHILASRARTLKIATTNWDTGQVVVFSNKPHEQRAGRDVSTKANYTTRMFTDANTTSAVSASAAIPGVFPPIKLDGENFVDGGLLMNTPLQPAIASNARTLHIVYVDPDLEKVARGEVQSTVYTLSRLMAVIFANIKEDIEYARLVRRLIATANRLKRLTGDGKSTINEPELNAFVADFASMTELTVHRHFPSRSLGGVTGMLDFRQQRLIETMELGFDDTVRHDCQANGCIFAPEIGCGG